MILSIITVTKNCVTTLERTLQSVQSIKNSDIEYLIIDGVSTDGTLDLIKKHRTLVDQIISEPDTGIYNAMNKGISFAKGEYTLFINGDDELVPNQFPELIRILQERRAEIICATTLVGSLSSPSERLIAKPLHLFFYNSIPHPSTCVSTSLLKTNLFREDLRIASDYDFFLQAYMKNQRFLIIPIVTALHQRGGASGDSALSTRELEQIKEKNLTWRYPLIKAIIFIYRFFKKLLAGLT